jgi:Winged helix DNA-binding domain
VRSPKQDLAQELARRTGSWVSQATFPGFGTQLPAWTIALGHAMAGGLICFGPNEGNRVTYVRIEQWLGPIERVEQEEALAWVLRRYLSAYGPATPAAFARWFSLPATAAKGLFARLADEIEPVDVEGWHAWRLRVDADLPAPCASARLLSTFDPYVVGCYPRDAMVPHDLVELLGDRGSTPWLRSLKKKEVRNLQVVLIDGKAAGVWQRRKSGKTTRIRVEAFDGVTRAHSDLIEREALRIGEFLGSQVELSFGRVEVRPHL